jgi:predicted ThiF/HesA family dinucleotide-utilizing enzyme
LLEATKLCFRDALEELAAHDGGSAKVQELVQKNLKSADLVERCGGVQFGPQDHAGFFERSKTDTVYTIHAKAFRGWFDRTGFTSALQWLDDEGFLIRSARRAQLPTQAGTAWAEQSPRWPNGQNVRSIIFRDPFRASKRASGTKKKKKKV